MTERVSNIKVLSEKPQDLTNKVRLSLLAYSESSFTDPHTVVSLDEPALTSRPTTQVGVTVYLTQVVGVDALHRVVVPVLANKHACFCTGQTTRGNACMFQRFPTDFEQQTLLRVQTLRFTGC